MKKKNMKKKSNKLALTAICALLGVGLIGGSLAYFSTNFSVDNVFSVGSIGAKFVENFEAPPEGSLVYGNTYDKSGQVANTGDSPVIARAKITAEWKDKDGATVDNKLATTPDKFAATLNFAATADFTTDFTSFNKSTTGTGKWVYNADGYFYYKNIVAGKASSDQLLESVSFSSDMGKSEVTKKYYVKAAYDLWQADPINVAEPTSYATQKDASLAAGGAAVTYVEETKSTYPAFENAVLTVKLEGEIIQYDAETYDLVKADPTKPWAPDFDFFLK